LKRALTTNSLEEAEAIESQDLDESDEEILKEIEATKSTKNISFFAFTATHKE
jgi:hypothetical protein